MNLKQGRKMSELQEPEDGPISIKRDPKKNDPFYKVHDGTVVDLSRIGGIRSIYSEFPGGIYLGGFCSFTVDYIYGGETRISKSSPRDCDRGTLEKELAVMREDLITAWKAYHGY
jgi:hypothetical protein